MSCNNFSAPRAYAYNRNDGVQRGISCGFNAGFAHFDRLKNCGPNAVKSGTVHEYPIYCEPPKTITIDRVNQIAGVDNALFLMGDVPGFRMGKNFMLEIPRNGINNASNNFPTYLLLKDGDAHTLGFSTSNIEAVCRQNAHMFSREGILRTDVSLFPELAPQDQATEGAGDCDRVIKTRIVSNTTLNNIATTIEITVWECNELIDREIWYIIPVRCENGDTLLGANMIIWDDNERRCGGFVWIPGRSTDNGAFILSNFPTRCGCRGSAYYNYARGAYGGYSNGYGVGGYGW